MTLREQVGQLVSCLERSAAEMSELGAKMKEQRKAFASLRGSELQAAVDSPEEYFRMDRFQEACTGR